VIFFQHQRSNAPSFWEEVYDEPESVLVIALLGLFYIFGACYLIGITGRELNTAVFVTSVVGLPLLCAGAQLFLARDAADLVFAARAQSVNHWTLIPGLLALAAVGSLGAPAWRAWGYAVVLATVTLHGLVLMLTLAVKRVSPGAPRLRPFVILAQRPAQIAALAIALFIALVSLFQISVTAGYSNVASRSIITINSIAPGRLHSTALWAAAIVLGAVALTPANPFFRTRPQPGPKLHAAVVALGIIVVCLLYFDFSLRLDAMHYLTNVGPALHIMHSGKLMVDAFSQYGPGPTAATLAALTLGPKTFGSAALLVQLFNLSFYALFLVCLSRMTTMRAASIVLGIVSIGVMFAGWGYGNYNFNEAPSVLGFRHLPTLLMVTALSLLQPPTRHSFLTGFATCFGAVWSIEALIGTLGTHLVFVTFLTLRERHWRRLAADFARTVLPALATIAVYALATWLMTGYWPDYAIYLAFLKDYNALSSWGLPADGLFWGWVPMAMAFIVVLADAWLRTMRPGRRILPISDDGLFYRCVPMAGLLAGTGAYFAGRGVDFTATIAFLPFCALAIPAFLGAVGLCRLPQGVPLLAVSAAALVLFWGVAVALATIYREGAPHAFLVQECRDRGRCSVDALFRAMNKEGLVFRPWFDQGRDFWYPERQGIVRDGKRLIELWASHQERPIVLLGQYPGAVDVGFSEAALMYTDKWHRWPRSWTFSDQLNDWLRAKILAAEVALRDGDIAIVRRDEGRLGVLEKAILEKVRSVGILCPVPENSEHVAAYRLSTSGDCPAL
jgi:hypothetical protein